MKNTLDDLRNHLFETLEALKDEETPMDLDRAKTISQVAQTIIDSAKVEVAFIETTNEDGSKLPFFNKRRMLEPVAMPALAAGKW